jgi:hypothetical protein
MKFPVWDPMKGRKVRREERRVRRRGKHPRGFRGSLRRGIQSNKIRKGSRILPRRSKSSAIGSPKKCRRNTTH